jgi:hypothetical protein
LSPDAYRSSREEDLNEWRESAGLSVKKIRGVTRDLRELQDKAGIKR